MSRVDNIAAELRDSQSGMYIYPPDAPLPVEIDAARTGQNGAQLTHLRVSSDNRRDGLATDALIALKMVLEADGIEYVEAKVGATTVPDDGSRPDYTDPTAQCLRLNGYQDVEPKRAPDDDAEWVFVGSRTLNPDRPE